MFVLQIFGFGEIIKVKVNNNIPFKTWKNALFSLIISLLEIATTQLYINYLYKMSNIVFNFMFLTMYILTVFLYYHLIYKHKNNIYVTGVRCISVVFQYFYIFIIYSIYFKFIHHVPQPTEGGGGPGGMWIIYAIFFIAPMPICINIILIIYLKICEYINTVYKKIKSRKE